jgi:hypothetical protein
MPRSHSNFPVISNSPAGSKYIQTQLGHAPIQVTMDRYGHLLPDVNQQASRRLEESLFGPSVRKTVRKSYLLTRLARCKPLITEG